MLRAVDGASTSSTTRILPADEDVSVTSSSRTGSTTSRTSTTSSSDTATRTRNRVVDTSTGGRTATPAKESYDKIYAEFMNAVPPNTTTVAQKELALSYIERIQNSDASDDQKSYWQNQALSLKAGIAKLNADAAAAADSSRRTVNTASDDSSGAYSSGGSRRSTDTSGASSGTRRSDTTGTPVNLGNSRDQAAAEAAAKAAAEAAAKAAAEAAAKAVAEAAAKAAAEAAAKAQAEAAKKAAEEAAAKAIKEAQDKMAELNAHNAAVKAEAAAKRATIENSAAQAAQKAEAILESVFAKGNSSEIEAAKATYRSQMDSINTLYKDLDQEDRLATRSEQIIQAYANVVAKGNEAEIKAATEALNAQEAQLEAQDQALNAQITQIKTQIDTINGSSAKPTTDAEKADAASQAAAKLTQAYNKILSTGTDQEKLTAKITYEAQMKVINTLSEDLKIKASNEVKSEQQAQAYMNVLMKGNDAEIQAATATYEAQQAQMQAQSVELNIEIAQTKAQVDAINGKTTTTTTTTTKSAYEKFMDKINDQKAGMAIQEANKKSDATTQNANALENFKKIAEQFAKDHPTSTTSYGNVVSSSNPAPNGNTGVASPSTPTQSDAFKAFLEMNTNFNKQTPDKKPTPTPSYQDPTTSSKDDSTTSDSYNKFKKMDEEFKKQFKNPPFGRYTLGN